MNNRWKFFLVIPALFVFVAGSAALYNNEDSKTHEDAMFNKKTISVDIKEGAAKTDRSMRVDASDKKKADTSVLPSNDGKNVEVVLHGSKDMRATDIDHTSIRLGDATSQGQRFEDVNNDGELDVVYIFAEKDLGAKDGEVKEFYLEGKTLDGSSFKGKDPVSISGQ